MTFQELVDEVNDERKKEKLEALKLEVKSALGVLRCNRRAVKESKEVLAKLEERYNKLTNVEVTETNA